MIFDNQMNGTAPGITDIYAAVGPQSLPLVEKLSRFKFFKRISRSNINSPFTTLDFTLKCNHTITYDASTGAATDLKEGNFIITACAPSDPTPNFNGVLRIMFVDA